MYYIFFIHSSVNEYLGCYCVLALVNNAVINSFFFFFFLLEDNLFTILCWFSAIHQHESPQTYICPLPPEPPSHLPPHLNAILMHAYGIWNDGADKPICRAAVEMQT